jgi:hypothetical protein
MIFDPHIETAIVCLVLAFIAILIQFEVNKR